MGNHLFNNFGIIETHKLHHLGEKTSSNGSMIMSCIIRIMFYGNNYRGNDGYSI